MPMDSRQLIDRALKLKCAERFLLLLAKPCNDIHVHIQFMQYDFWPWLHGPAQFFLIPTFLVALKILARVLLLRVDVADVASPPRWPPLPWGGRMLLGPSA
jgi:hypothetical protein